MNARQMLAMACIALIFGLAGGVLSGVFGGGISVYVYTPESHAPAPMVSLPLD